MLKKPSHAPDSHVRLSHAQRGNLEYIDTLYQEFLKDPLSVESEWKLFFEGVEFAKSFEPSPGTPLNSPHLQSEILSVYQLIESYRTHGHLEANLNPLIVNSTRTKELTLERFGLSNSHLAKSFPTFGVMAEENAPLQAIVDRLRQTYCGNYSAQFTDADPLSRDWLTSEYEKGLREIQFSLEEKKTILGQLTRVEAFEKFLHARFVGAKRFSIEGTDSLIPMLEYLVSKGRQNGMEEIVVGMAHRGRLNVLANFMGKPLKYFFAEFDGLVGPRAQDIDGDVKYHLGYSSERETSGGRCRLTLAFNPSHLEAINPIACGIVRAKQRQIKDVLERKKVVPVLVHGDAAMAGQGVVVETLQLSQLRGYRVGGVLHIISNNQVGFTTDPRDSRSSQHPSDVAKAIGCPVLHVNADDIESCLRVMDLAIRYRQSFNRDIVINLVGYRRFGHNEGDEPGFTQPTMYQLIQKHSTVRDLYAQQIVGENLLKKEDTDQMLSAEMARLQLELEQTRKTPPEVKATSYQTSWTGLKMARGEDFKRPADTTVSKEVIQKVGRAILSYPEGFNIHPKIRSLLDRRAKMVEEQEPCDWGMSELLAYGTLLAEGNPVRLTGQDCIRGTFTHRHSMYFDSKTGDGFNPLNTINPPREFCVYNSPLSEFAVLGFEYGNSITDPTILTVWEAQFGDFANGAQIVIDQFISSAEMKWAQMSGLVMLLPHGYEGQGPEHSSARLERFLQLCAQDNMQVCNLTTPAQLFHVLRRQLKRDFRKPLVIMSPKSLLRHPKVISTLTDLTDGSFSEVLDDAKATNKDQVENVILCSGKIYYELDDERERKPSEKIALVRIEQLYPLADEKIAQILNSYPHRTRVTWVQEEPQNMGAQSFIMPRLQKIVSELVSKLNGHGVDLRYIGRNFRASPATGSNQLHKVEQSSIISACFSHGETSP